MYVILSEILTTEYVLSTPFNALLGRVPVVVYAVLENTAVIQIIGEDDRRVVRHDFINVNPDKLRARATPVIDQLHRSRIKGRINSLKQHEKNGTETPNPFEIFDETDPIIDTETGRAEYPSLEEMARIAEEDSS